MLHSLMVSLHLLAAVIWVGGMFFAYMMVRPAMAALQPPEPVRMWGRIFTKFFSWVWIAVFVLVATGNHMLIVEYGGMAAAPVYLHIMQLLGYLMIALFMHLYFAPWRRMQVALVDEDFPRAAKQIPQIRRIVAINLSIGIVNVILGAGGRYFSI
jgi:uncharacterized membrane protein